MKLYEKTFWFKKYENTLIVFKLLLIFHKTGPLLFAHWYKTEQDLGFGICYNCYNRSYTLVQLHWVVKFANGLRKINYYT